MSDEKSQRVYSTMDLRRSGSVLAAPFEMPAI